MENKVIEVEIRSKETVVAEIMATMSHVQDTAIVGAIKIGNGLKELKELIPHGKWEKYVKENLNFSKRKTSEFIRLADTYGNKDSEFSRLIANRHTCADLDISKYSRLLLLPETEAENFVKNTKLDNISIKELEKEVSDYKEKVAAKEENIKALKLAVEEKDKELVEERANGSKEGIAKLEKELEETKAHLEEERKKKIKDIEVASNKAKKEALEEMLELKVEKENLHKELESAKKRAQNASDEKMVGFKIKMDSFQETIMWIKNCIVEVEMTDKAKSEKMETLVKDIFNKLFKEEKK